MLSDPDEHDEAREHEEIREHDDGTHAHLDGVSDGCGCIEIWEELSERRADAE